ncbi:uncharacterized protein [Dysidea avara]|uniref:uncharacterized protein isoform X2 n=1 Tax=Dysidea avara TaxID=196820 RepID=UPI0033265DBE
MDKKWMKKDAYLFQHEMPVIYLSPRGADLSSSTYETIHLDDITSVWHISKFFKHNVLAIGFSSFYVLIAFESKSQRELWYSELMYLTDIFTLLLYKCSHQSVKLGYYQLRFMLGNLVVYDAITKKTAWKWKVAHISGYRFEKTAAVEILVGKESDMDGFFCFTGKKIKPFCKRLQQVGLNLAQKGNCKDSVKEGSQQPTANKPEDDCINKSHEFNFCLTSPDSDYKLCESKVLAKVPASVTVSSSDLRQTDTVSPTRLYSNRITRSFNCILSPSKITNDLDMPTGKFNRFSLRKSTSCDCLNETLLSLPVSYSTYKMSSKKRLTRRCYSLDNLSVLIHDDQDGGYIMPSLQHGDRDRGYVIASLQAKGNDYLELLPATTYEEIQDHHVYDEINNYLKK